MGADDHPTVVPTNWDDGKGETRLYRVYMALDHGDVPQKTAVLLDAADSQEALFRAELIGLAFGVNCSCQVEVREADLYV